MVKSFLVAASILGALEASNAAAVLVTNNAMLSGPKGGWNTTVWAVDTSAGSAEMIADTYLPRPAQTAVVCNSVYYTVWADPPNYGMRMLDLVSGKSSDLATTSLFHVLACDPTNSSRIMGTASDFTSTHGAKEAYTPRTSRDVAADAGGSVPFHLKSYDPATQTEAVIGTFPSKDVIWAGYDGIFSFSKDASEVWASWPIDTCPGCPGAKKGGHVHVMDTATGTIKTNTAISFPGLLAKKGSPYFVLPDAKRATFLMDGNANLQWADLTVAGGKIEAKITKTSASDLWGFSMPVELCGENYIGLQKSTSMAGAAAVQEFAAKDGGIVSRFDLSNLPILGQPNTDLSALACARPSPPAPAPPTPPPAPPARRRSYRIAATQSSCTGPGESCCPAPGGDVNNCPDSARTTDCDAKKSCCCG
jgi:hypothetical protein